MNSLQSAGFILSDGLISVKSLANVQEGSLLDGFLRLQAHVPIFSSADLHSPSGVPSISMGGAGCDDGPACGMGLASILGCCALEEASAVDAGASLNCKGACIAASPVDDST